MNKKLYLIIGIILIIVLVYGGYRFMNHYKNMSMYNTNTQSTSNNGSVGLTNKTDTSNQQLDQDLQDIQGSMNKLNADQSQSEQAASNQFSDTPSQ